MEPECHLENLDQIGRGRNVLIGSRYLACLSLSDRLQTGSSSLSWKQIVVLGSTLTAEEKSPRPRDFRGKQRPIVQRKKMRQRRLSWCCLLRAENSKNSRRRQENGTEGARLFVWLKLYQRNAFQVRSLHVRISRTESTCH